MSEINLNGSYSEDFESLYEDFLEEYKAQLLEQNIPTAKWKALFRKLKDLIFNTGDSFILVEESEDNDSENGFTATKAYKAPFRVYTKHSMTVEDADNIFLIDHAWTYSLEGAKSFLQENESLLQRMCSMMGLKYSSNLKELCIEEVLEKIWLYNDSYYWVDKASDKHVRCFYVMDELGSAIRRSDTSTFELKNFTYNQHDTIYSILYPITNVEEMEEVTISYPSYPTTANNLVIQATKFPWNSYDFTSSMDLYQQMPNEEYFASGRFTDIMPEILPPTVPLSTKSTIKVYTEYREIVEHLTLGQFEFVTTKEEADVLWLASRFNNYSDALESRKEIVYVNQFPSEQVITNKELLIYITRNALFGGHIDQDTLNTEPKWFPTTFSLVYEIPHFISYFQIREKRGLDNTWIVKPFNLARGMDIHIMNNASQIVRMGQMGKMIAMKYITDPVLFPRENIGLVKIDLRFIVLLKSVRELEVFLYDRFWIRFANKPFSLDDLADYETHFTVMNYSDFPLQQMYCHDFVKKFEEHYETYKWEDVMIKIRYMVKTLFVAAVAKQPPMGIGNYPGSRAMYGLDVMLEWNRDRAVPEMQPKLIEVNFLPDCKRACQYYPEYYNDVFSVLFLDETEGKHVTRL